MAARQQSGMVSIVVTCWNRSQYIRACLDGIAKQTYRNIEVIIVDDGSTDNSLQIIRNWKASLPTPLRSKVVIVALPRNMGYPGAQTTAFYMARGEFIAIHDSDDVSHPDRIRKQVQYLRQNRRIGLVGTNYRIIQNGRILEKNPGWLAFGAENVQKRYRQNVHCITCGSTLFRRSVFDRFGGFTRRMRGAEDYDFILRLHRGGVKMDNLRYVLYYVRHHGNQLSLTIKR